METPVQLKNVLELIYLLGPEISIISRGNQELSELF